MARERTRSNGSGGASVIDVAAAANVSLGTVSRVMNGVESVNPELRRRVLSAARGIGFVPRTLHRHLAVLVGRRNPRVPIGYTHILTALVEEFAYQRGMSVELFDIGNLEQAYDCRVEAVIGVVFDDRITQLVEVPNLPVVAINHPLAHRGVHSIYCDHREQGSWAAGHLIDRGHRRVAFLGNLPDEHGDVERLAGYREAMAASGLSLDPDWVRFATQAPVYDTVQRWVRNGITAILNLSEDVVPEVLHVLANVLNLRIGGDISTISLEDVPLYQYFTPPQTVIRQPLRELARLAVEQALQLAEVARTGDPEATGGVVDVCLHGELVPRDSVARLRP